VSAPETVVALDAAQLAADVAARTLDTLAAAQADHGVASLVVTGGSILERVFAALRDSPDRGKVDWTKVTLWWGDERFVPADSADRNDTAALRAGLGALPFDPANIHPMAPSDGRYGADAAAAAAGYDAELAAASGAADDPRFDLVLLGVGPDGHCASLFPDHPGVDDESEAVVAVQNSPKPPPTRITLTFRGLNSADEVWVIASGNGKANAVAMALSGADRVQVPSAGARGRKRTLWLIDQDAAADLPS
jgi:6-phosphogluconolactonase